MLDCHFLAVASVALLQEKQKIKSTWWQRCMITRMSSGEKQSCHHKTLLPIDCFYFLSQKAAKKRRCGKVVNAAGGATLPLQDHHHQCCRLIVSKLFLT